MKLNEIDPSTHVTMASNTVAYVNKKNKEVKPWWDKINQRKINYNPDPPIIKFDQMCHPAQLFRHPIIQGL